ncbi:OLC1v1032118C1 [Oldenlandia corymbosa var. corymbosa]|uniref:OLC1v1032118C1 n=1 Tax=Oldenlandia corymbosa var. corymbosa TaxID=529605 RepID=A0AAV1CKX3_OLDCO|nr:OLC1v1032118C1 [Oldenlandia corymbosa var. corymbosa]
MDPPPWLNRIRQIGCPPAYLAEQDKENQPSEITIFGADRNREGEILEKSLAKPDKRMTVKFPPEIKADKKLWESWPAESKLYRDQYYYNRCNQTLDSGSRGYYYQDRRPPMSRSFEDDEPPPPGCDNNERPTPFCNWERYGESDSSYYNLVNPRNNLEPRSCSFARSLSDRSRRQPLDRHGSWYHPYGYI